MNILMLNWRDIKNPKSGGAEIVTLEHLVNWSRNGHKVVWFSSAFKNSKEKEIVNGIEIVRKGNLITVFIHAFIYYFKNKNNIDFVVDQIHGIPFFTPLYVKKPKIAFIHEVAGEIWDHMYPFPINIIGKNFEKYYFRLYKKIIFWVPSNSTAVDLIGNGIDRRNCKVILASINNSVLSKPGKKNSNPTFIFASRLVKMKGVEEVIKAFFIIQHKIPKSKLVIVGEGNKNYVEKLKSKYEITSNSNIKFYGYVTQSKKIELMESSNLILHASIKEGWGLVIIEAASRGTPSVVYDVGGLRDSTIKNKTGIILSVNSPESMAEAAIDLLANEKKYYMFQSNCIDWARSITWQKATRESLSLIERVARNKSS